jgi:hypothetical protein
MTAQEAIAWVMFIGGQVCLYGLTIKWSKT